MKLKKYKREALNIAKDLCYKAHILEQIKNARTIIEVDNALIRGRREM